MKREVIEKRLEIKTGQLDAAYQAYSELLSGNVQRYVLGSRELTRLDLEKLGNEIRTLENEVENLEALLKGGSRRKAVAVIPRDW